MRLRVWYSLALCQNPAQEELRSLLGSQNLMWSGIERYVYALALSERKNVPEGFCEGVVPGMRAELKQWRLYIDSKKIRPNNFTFVISSGDELGIDQARQMLDTSRKYTWH